MCPTEWMDLSKEEIVRLKDKVIEELKRQIGEMDREMTRIQNTGSKEARDELRDNNTGG